MSANARAGGTENERKVFLFRARQTSAAPPCRVISEPDKTNSELNANFIRSPVEIVSRGIQKITPRPARAIPVSFTWGTSFWVRCSTFRSDGRKLGSRSSRDVFPRGAVLKVGGGSALVAFRESIVSSGYPLVRPHRERRLRLLNVRLRVRNRHDYSAILSAHRALLHE